MSGNGEFTSETVQQYGAMVSQVSNEYHRKYRMVEKDDIAQELWMWFASHTRKITEWTIEVETTKDLDNLIAKSIRNAAYDYCFKEKARVEGYSTEDVFFYKKEFIKLLLPAVLADDVSKIAATLTLGGKAPKAPSESNDWMAYSADIKKALSKLEDKDRELVELFYGQDMDGATLHEQVLPEKSTPRAAMMQANRALNKMVRELGGFPPQKDYDKDIKETVDA